jgi:hypothetical protein
MASHSPAARPKMLAAATSAWSERQELLLAAAEEANQLYASACRENEQDAPQRLKILCDISGQLPTSTLLMLALACSESQRRGELEQELRSYLAGPLHWNEEFSWSSKEK